MIGPMAWLGRIVLCTWACALACGGPQSAPDEPQTAKEKQLQEARANGELDDSSGGKWGGWKYQGSRDDCFYVAGRRCFATVKTACSSLHCKAPAKCNAVGGGPATVSCVTAAAK
jgi:hypothetical protein